LPADSRLRHPFEAAPSRTLLALALPVLVSLLAEPLTGLADTFFLARLGMAPLAALGVATTLLSGILWVFNFLGIGTQTEVARALGSGEVQRAREAAGLAFAAAVVLGSALALAAWPVLAALVGWMGAVGEARDAATAYLQIRLFGAPAVLITLAAFGALRGLQDMRTPLWIAVSINAVNIVLDPLLIFGAGSIPALGISGAAWASTVSQWAGALWAIVAVRARLGLAFRVQAVAAMKLLVVGRDLALRTGFLLAFQVVATQRANRAGVDAGAAHQAVRQFWIVSALVLDAYAAAAQSLVGYFVGSGELPLARRVAAVSCAWSAGTGVLLAAGMLAATSPVAAAFVPPDAHPLFATAWIASALAQPANALAFATDGIHWGTADYPYLRNAMFVATLSMGAALYWIDPASDQALLLVWLVTAAWIAIRAAFGMLRIWPAPGRGPLRMRAS
jgi:MATE family multidrug resistance protein